MCMCSSALGRPAMKASRSVMARGYRRAAFQASPSAANPSLTEALVIAVTRAYLCSVTVRARNSYVLRLAGLSRLDQGARSGAAVALGNPALSGGLGGLLPPHRAL